MVLEGGGGRNFQNSKKPISPHEELNAEYKERITVLPEDINDKMTNLLLAAQVTHLPLKVLQFEKHMVINLQKIFPAVYPEMAPVQTLLSLLLMHNI